MYFWKGNSVFTLSAFKKKISLEKSNLFKWQITKGSIKLNIQRF